MHLLHIPQCSFQNRSVHIYELGQVVSISHFRDCFRPHNLASNKYNDIDDITVNVHRASHEKYARFALCCVLLWFDTDGFYPYLSGLLHWNWGNRI